jgi:tenascin
MKLDFCSGFGVCHLGNFDGTRRYGCMCFEGSSGRTCDQVEVMSKCPNYCSGNGKCILRPHVQCQCDGGWMGSACDVSVCPSINGRICNGRGLCELAAGAYQCTCGENWSNGPLLACELKDCPNKCNNQGDCLPNGTCSCDTRFTGSDCSSAAPAPTAKAMPVEEDLDAVEILPCLNDCSGHGECQDGVCLCLDGFIGTDCGIAPSIPMSDEGGGFELQGLLQFDERDNAGDEFKQDPDRVSMATLWE